MKFDSNSAPLARLLIPSCVSGPIARKMTSTRDAMRRLFGELEVVVGRYFMIYNKLLKCLEVSIDEPCGSESCVGHWRGHWQCQPWLAKSGDFEKDI
jgi:hypothetical protein